MPSDSEQLPLPTPPEKKKRGRPKGSKNKPGVGQGGNGKRRVGRPSKKDAANGASSTKSPQPPPVRGKFCLMLRLCVVSSVFRVDFASNLNVPRPGPDAGPANPVVPLQHGECSQVSMCDVLSFTSAMVEFDQYRKPWAGTSAD